MLDTDLAKLADIETFVHLGDQISESLREQGFFARHYRSPRRVNSEQAEQSI